MTELFVLAKCQNDERDGFYLITFLKVSTLHPMIITPLHNLDFLYMEFVNKKSPNTFWCYNINSRAVAKQHDQCF